MAFLYWLFMTPLGKTAFIAYLLATAIAVWRSDRKRKPLPIPTFDLESILLRPSPRARDFRSN
jgi:hypothetical protein